MGMGNMVKQHLLHAQSVMPSTTCFQCRTRQRSISARIAGRAWDQQQKRSECGFSTRYTKVSQESWELQISICRRSEDWLDWPCMLVPPHLGLNLGIFLHSRPLRRYKAAGRPTVDGRLANPVRSGRKQPQRDFRPGRL